MEKIRLLLADDHNILRQGLIDILKSYNDIIVVAEAENGKEMVDKYEKCYPDVVLSDIQMPILSGFQAAGQIIQKHPDAKILFLSMHFSEEYIYKVESLGGKGLLSKAIVKDELVSAIRTVYNNGSYYFGIDEVELERIKNRNKEILNRGNNQNTVLTPREHDILLEIATGNSSEEISLTLGIGKRTVDAFRSIILKKLNIDTLPKLIKYAIRYKHELTNTK